jgi:hypothetical protein
MDRVIQRLLDDGAGPDDIEIQHHPDRIRILCWNGTVAEYSTQIDSDKMVLRMNETVFGGRTTSLVQFGH